VSDQLFVKVYVNIVEHPKMLAVPRACRWAFIDLLAYAKRNLTDGYVPAAVLDRIEVSTQEIAALVWSGLVEEVDGGYWIHDYLDWQVSRALVEKRREAGRRGGIRSGQVRASKQNEASASKQTKQNEATGYEANEPETETETEKRTTRALARRAAEREPASFADFWSMYPRKVGKRAAMTAYAKALTRASAEDILDGLRRLLPTMTDPKFIPHPTTWLNRDGWGDDPAPTGSTAALYDLAEQARRLEEGTRFFA